MATVLGTLAKEESTYTITVSFFDDDDVATTPASATWTLSDLKGNIINSREDVSIGSLGTSVEIKLSGDDLAIGLYGTTRVFTIQGVDSAGDPFNDECRFDIENLVNVP